MMFVSYANRISSKENVTETIKSLFYVNVSNIYLNSFHRRFFYISTPLNVSVFDWLRMSWTHFVLWLRHKPESYEAAEPVKSKTTRFAASRTVFITTNAKTRFLKFHQHKRVAEVREWRHVAESSFNLPVVAFSF